MLVESQYVRKAVDDSTKCPISVKALEHDFLSTSPPSILANRLHLSLIYTEIFF